MPGAVPASTPKEIHRWVAEGQRRVRFGIYNGPLADWSAMRTWAETIEELGFDSLWIGDHTMLYPVDCWTTLAALAVHTMRLRLGPLVSCIYYRPPGLLARMAADVDRKSEGRLVLGLGVGDVPKEFQQLGLPEPPFRERARALTALAATTPFVGTMPPRFQAGLLLRLPDVEHAALAPSQAHQRPRRAAG